MNPDVKAELRRLKKLGIVAYDAREQLERRLKDPKFRAAYERERVRAQLSLEVSEIRKKKKLTQKQLAERADMPQSVVARLESGTHSVSVETLGRIAQALGKKIRLA